MTKKIAKVIIIFLVGAVGGIFADQIICPYFWEQPAVRVIEKSETIIQENTALEEAVGKVEKTVISILTKTKSGKSLTGSGIIVSSDGLVITLAELLPQGGIFAFFIGDEAQKYQVLKRDLKNNLALVELEKRDLPTVGFADSNNLKLGEKVFLVGSFLDKTSFRKTVNEGIIRFISQDYFQTNILEKSALIGSPLFDIKGELLGLSIIGIDGNVSAIPASKVRNFLGF